MGGNTSRMAREAHPTRSFGALIPPGLRSSTRICIPPQTLVEPGGSEEPPGALSDSLGESAADALDERIGVHCTATAGVVLEVEVRVGGRGVAGASHVADDLASRHLDAGGDAVGDAVEVGVV